MDTDHQERILNALRHEWRRDIVKILMEERGQVSPIEISRKMDLKVSLLSYHFKVLREKELIELVDQQQKRGAVEHFYVLAPHIAENSIIQAVMD